MKNTVLIIDDMTARIINDSEPAIRYADAMMCLIRADRWTIREIAHLGDVAFHNAQLFLSEHVDKRKTVA